ncbi:MAG: DUF503 domain-containing protein [Thermoanaerobaculia bacterium]
MIVAVSVFELHIPAARSLKDKRRVVKALMEKIHHRYRVSIAETDYHDVRQRTEISIAAVHGTEAKATRLMDGIHSLIEQSPEAQLLSWDPEYLEPVR